ncbi:MAG: hypothetical protein IT181_02405 [Acidobacteria bacterium]|nr:hypothetical protein [Acidobacteriota bacterium]
MRHIRDVTRLHRDELDEIGDDATRTDRLVELNVMEQVFDLSRTVVVRDAWASGRPVKLHGWVYRLTDGLITDLGTTIEAPIEDTTRVSTAKTTLRRLLNGGQAAAQRP